MTKITDLRGFAALSARNFRLYFFGQCCALTGSWMQRVALVWLVMILTESGAKMGMVDFLNQAPAFFIGIFVGSFLDRHDLRWVLIGTQVCMIVHSIVLAVLVYTGTVTYEAVLFLSFLLGLVSAVDMPARQASVSQMIDHPSQLQSALSLQSSSFNLARLFGPAVAGLIIKFSGELACFVANAVAHLAVLYAYVIMVLPPRKKSTTVNIMDSLREGLGYVWKVTPIRLCILFNYVFCFLAIPHMVLLPIFVRNSMGGDSSHYGYMLAGIGLGALCGAMFIAFRVSVVKLPSHIWHMQTLFGVSLLVFSLVTNWAVALLLTPVVGFSLVSSLVSNNSLVQALVDEDKRGRVLSYYSMGILGFGPIGSLVAGKLADHTTAQITIGLCAVACLLLGLAHSLRQKTYDATVPPIAERKGLI